MILRVARKAPTDPFLVVRAWREPHSAAPCRFELRRSVDDLHALDERQWFASADELCDAIRTWLEEIDRGR